MLTCSIIYVHLSVKYTEVNNLYSRVITHTYSLLVAAESRLSTTIYLSLHTGYGCDKVLEASSRDVSLITCQWSRSCEGTKLLTTFVTKGTNPPNARTNAQICLFLRVSAYTRIAANPIHCEKIKMAYKACHTPVLCMIMRKFVIMDATV